MANKFSYSRAAQKNNHHPDWRNLYNTVEVMLTTDDLTCLTTFDFALAQGMDLIYNTTSTGGGSTAGGSDDGACEISNADVAAIAIGAFIMGIAAAIGVTFFRSTKPSGDHSDDNSLKQLKAPLTA